MHCSRRKAERADANGDVATAKSDAAMKRKRQKKPKQSMQKLFRLVVPSLISSSGCVLERLQVLHMYHSSEYSIARVLFYGKWCCRWMKRGSYLFVGRGFKVRAHSVRRFSPIRDANLAPVRCPAVALQVEVAARRGAAPV